MIRVALVVALSGCHSLFSIDHVDDPPREDGGGVTDDAPDDVIDGEVGVCFGTGLAKNVCPTNVMGPTTLDDETINTDTDGRCNTHTPTIGPELCVIAASSITVSGVVTGRGNRPLVLLATGTLVIEATGRIDVSSHSIRGFPTEIRRGAGRSVAGCTPGPGRKQSTFVPSGAGGGAGGSFQGRGGNGGAGDDSNVANSSPAVALPTFVRGGCAGGEGGGDTTFSGGGNGGDSGGAVYLIAGSAINVVGHIFAWGAGGYGGVGGATAKFQAGGGGGSGGLIGLDAPNVTLRSGSLVLAEGGAGGGGADGVPAGEEGREQDPTQPALEIKGGVGAGDAGDGGRASTVAILSGAPGQAYGSVDGGGAGGGGGGAGYVLVYSALFVDSGTVMPSPLTP